MTEKRKNIDHKWDIRFLELAEFISAWSKDPRAKVGAAVVTKEGGAVALGYNGFPAGIEDNERIKDKELKLDMIIHAEQNALLIAGTRAKGATLYVWGKPVCARCAVVIIQSGITRIILTNPEDEGDKSSKWYKLGKLAVSMFKEAGITVEYYKVEKKENKRNFVFIHPGGILEW
jgi:dCMP deaminase